MSGTSYVPKVLFNAIFLIINVLILVANFGLMRHVKEAPALQTRAVQQPPRWGEPLPGWERRLNGSDLHARGVGAAVVGTEGIQSGAPAQARPQIQPRVLLNEKHQIANIDTSSGRLPVIPWDKYWDSGHVAAHGGALRRIWLVRHGDYHRTGIKQGHLSDIGKSQIEKTGKRLKEIGIAFDSCVSSTSVRARETTEIISKYLATVRIDWSELLKEGQPFYPEPGFPDPKPNDKSFNEDGKRLDMAFRRYIHRGSVTKEVSNHLIIAHGNVIGFFTLRGLQLPSERWLKVQVIQGSISMYEITPDGQFNVRILGDMGHIPVNDWTG